MICHLICLVLLSFVCVPFWSHISSPVTSCSRAKDVPPSNSLKEGLDAQPWQVPRQATARGRDFFSIIS